MSANNKAVFLSYASQDAEAARRICEALRSGGVEVWFDADGGLEHGDEWDAKIRRQIKECVLFIPVISANTQARHEGYFRIEWDLAAERARGIAGGVPFILPVVIDDTREPDALVPDRFRAVQWTKLRGGEVPPEVKQRFLKLWSHRTGVLKHEAAREEGTAANPPAATPHPMGAARVRPRAIATIVGFALAAAAIGWWQPWRHTTAWMPVAPAASAAKAPASPAPMVAVASFPHDPNLKRAWDLFLGKLNNTAEDFALAEDIVKSVVAQRPTDPEVIIVYATLNDAYLNRGFDLSEERYVLGRRYAERAAQLAPEDPEALAALGQFLSFRRADLARAEQLLRRAIELNPREPRYYRALAYNVVRFTRQEEALQIAQHTADLFPNDALVHYELALHYRDAGRIDDMERTFDRALALAPLGAAMIWKTWIVGWVHGDVAGMKPWLDRLPADIRLSDRALTVRHQFARLTQQPAELEEVARALQAFPGTMFRDFYYIGPKALLVGDVFAALGKRDLAKGQYELALTEVARQKAATPANFNALMTECWTLFGLGRRDEALADLHAAVNAGPPDYRPFFYPWWFDVIPACLMLGDRELALREIKWAATRESVRHQVRVALRIDPRMGPFRDDPEITALLAEPKKEAAAPTAGAKSAPADKSVAVLAFANLSDDKGNEYFSDGISEELLTVLQKIPGLHVAARTSAFSFKGKTATAQEIGATLNVAHLVEGSVQKIGNRVKISARLSRAATGEQLWSENFKRDLADVFTVQSEIAQTIVAQLRGQLTGEEATAAKAEIQAQVQVAQKGGTKNVEAHELYLQGKFFAARNNSDDVARGIGYYEKSIAADASFAAAWVGLARARAWQGSFEPLNTVRFREARIAAERALTLEPELAEAHSTISQLMQRHYFDWHQARESSARALQLAPDNVEVLIDACTAGQVYGDWERSIAAGQHAVALDPVNAEPRLFLAISLLYSGRLSQAELEIRRMIALEPAGLFAHLIACQTLLMENRPTEALAEARQEPGRMHMLEAVALAEFACGHRGEADAALRTFETEFADGCPYQIAEVYAFRGEADSAFKWLEHAWQIKDPGVSWVRSATMLRNLRSDPRWPGLLKKFGLSDEQLK